MEHSVLSPEVLTYFQRKASDYERWLKGMARCSFDGGVKSYERTRRAGNPKPKPIHLPRDGASHVFPLPQ